MAKIWFRLDLDASLNGASVEVLTDVLCTPGHVWPSCAAVTLVDGDVGDVIKNTPASAPWLGVNGDATKNAGDWPGV